MFQTFIRLFDYQNEAINSLIVGGRHSDSCICNDRLFSNWPTSHAIFIIVNLLVITIKIGK